MAFNIDVGIEDLGPYQVHSRREILALLRGIGERNRLVRMIFSGGSEAVLTSILKIDEAADSVIIDCAPDQLQNQRIVESGNISFETILERIRILFFATSIENCLYENGPAFRIALPASLIRLQRREYYRVFTLRCTIDIPHDAGQGMKSVTLSVQNVSAGGMAIVDEKKILDDTTGRIYENCKIVLPTGTAITATLEVRNSQEITLANGKAVRRLGCLFIDLPNPMLAAVQRYITKLERDQNAKTTGMA
jgi:c-di-GMP-binding flagellar brake protein YcgR